MTEAKARTLLKKKWKYLESEEDYFDSEAVMVTYRRNLNFTWCDEVDVTIIIKGGKVKRIEYVNDGD